jgi:hypothetical protein
MISNPRVQDILKRYRFDLPAGIEHDYANWDKIATFVGYTLTQARAKVKKAVRILILSPNLYNGSLNIISADQREHQGQHECIYSCTADRSFDSLPSDGSTLCACSAHGMPVSS